MKKFRETPLIRTFIAVNLAAPVVEEIAKVQLRLKQAKADIRWVRVEGMHLTLKFLGEIDYRQVVPIVDRLHAALREQAALQVTARGLGGFPNLNRPRVIWVGLSGNGLTELRDRVEAALVRLDFPPEARRFTPHMTLGRVRSQRGWNQVLALIRQSEQADFGQSVIDTVTVYQSDLQPTGAVYTPLGSIPLQQP